MEDQATAKRCAQAPAENASEARTPADECAKAQAKTASASHSDAAQEDVAKGDSGHLKMMDHKRIEDKLRPHDGELAELRVCRDVVAGKHAGRTSDDQVTICDLTGTGAQDTAIATYALARARQAGAGSVIAT